MLRSLKERLKVPHRHRPNFSNPGATDPTDCSSMGHRDWSQSQASVASPKVLEPVGRHFGVSDRVLDVLVPEVVLQRPRVVAIVGELETAGVSCAGGSEMASWRPRRRAG